MGFVIFAILVIAAIFANSSNTFAATGIMAKHYHKNTPPVKAAALKGAAAGASQTAVAKDASEAQASAAKESSVAGHPFAPGAFAVYVLTNHIGVFYVDITDNLPEAVRFHKQNADPHSFIARFDVRKLSYYELYTTAAAARTRADALKSFSAQEMMRCITRMNPENVCLLETLDGTSREQQPVLLRPAGNTKTKRKSRNGYTPQFLRLPSSTATSDE